MAQTLGMVRETLGRPAVPVGPEQLLLRPTKAADVLDLSRSTIYEMMAAGILPSVKVGKARRIPMAALRAWVEAQQAAQQPEPPNAA